MRDRLLAGGPDALPDYEVLEMLLFLGIPRRDTKPLAKATINRFGSLAAVLGATPAELRQAPGLGPDSVAALKLVEAATARLTRAESVERPLLSSWDRLMDYLAFAPIGAAPLRVLFLDNRNRLLADEPWPAATEAPQPRDVITRALELHSTALILLQRQPAGWTGPGRPEAALSTRLRRAAAVLSIVLHDHLILGGPEPVSLRRAGLLAA
ncbi:DNA repair protein RadC [Roseomonas sp. OT10]|uniref:JAB domain-containing protein n=1 Tax=Roseomonas cutis TaxID=2897332 RepID=UPI001E3CF069|nr:DNA repair protein RadC [Roseomonas sp. OT10]UFN49581.1 DNA repair protein RadC [Roseomonas sp. OT10]